MSPHGIGSRLDSDDQAGQLGIAGRGVAGGSGQLAEALDSRHCGGTGLGFGRHHDADPVPTKRLSNHTLSHTTPFCGFCELWAETIPKVTPPLSNPVVLRFRPLDGLEWLPLSTQPTQPTKILTRPPR